MAKPTTSEKTVAPAEARQDAPGGARGRRGRKARPSTWKRWGKQLERAQKLLAKIAAASGHPGLPGESVEVRNARLELGRPVVAIQKQVAALIVMDAEGVPEPKYAAPPKFTAGQAVRITKAAVPKYTRDGLYSAADLAELEVSKVSANGKAFLCAGKAGAVRVASFKHLEPRS